MWETVIGERDANFNHVSTGGKDAVKSVISSGHPLKSRIDSYYVCGDDWTIKEIEPSEGYLLDSASYHVGAEAKLYTVERNSAPAIDVTDIRGSRNIKKKELPD